MNDVPAELFPHFSNPGQEELRGVPQPIPPCGLAPEESCHE